MSYCYGHHQEEELAKDVVCVYAREDQTFYHPLAVICFIPGCACKTYFVVTENMEKRKYNKK